MNAKRIKRLKRLHARALGMYMAHRASGDSAEVQKRRLDRLTSALLAEMEIKNEEE